MSSSIAIYMSLIVTQHPFFDSVHAVSKWSKSQIRRGELWSNSGSQKPQVFEMTRTNFQRLMLGTTLDSSFVSSRNDRAADMALGGGKERYVCYSMATRAKDGGPWTNLPFHPISKHCISKTLVCEAERYYSITRVSIFAHYLTLCPILHSSHLLVVQLKGLRRWQDI